jgi:4-hydroxyphenylpyruvate dioxygenase
MADLFENPMGLMGFEFVEFASPTPGVLEPLFEQLGFTKVAVHRSKDVVLYRQGEINFIVNNEPKSYAAYFAAEHGPSACGMAFRVKDSHKAYKLALELGAQAVEIPTGPMELRLPAIKGIGGAPLYLIDRFEDGKSIYDIDFEFLPNVERRPVGHGLKIIDHLTHNVYRGRMAFWAGFYEKLFNFREIRYFDIKGEYTGLTSKAMTAPDGMIRIPLNEEGKAGGGQIEEFLMQFNGEGIQHIALLTDDLIKTVDSLRAAGVPLMSAPPRLITRCWKAAFPATARTPANCRRAACCWTEMWWTASRACCCRFSRRRSWGRCSSNSSSARAMTASARATSRRCSSRSSATRSSAARSGRRRKSRKKIGVPDDPAP